MSYLCPRPYRADGKGKPWIVLTSRRTRSYRTRLVAEIVAFFVQRRGTNVPIGLWIRREERKDRRRREKAGTWRHQRRVRRELRRRRGKRAILMQAYGGDPDA